MAMTSDQIKGLILEAFPDAQLELSAFQNDNDHYSAVVKSSAFSGKSKVEQHQMVYEALQGHMGTTLHALSLKTQVLVE